MAYSGVDAWVIAEFVLCVGRPETIAATYFLNIVWFGDCAFISEKMFL